MKKFRKGISALMALVMMLSCVSIMTVTASAEELTVIPKDKTLSYSFKNFATEGGNGTFSDYSDTLLPSYGDSDPITTSITSYDSKDGYVSVTASNNTDGVCYRTKHGSLYFNGEATIKFKVAGDATIQLGVCAWPNNGAIDITVAKEGDGTLKPESFSNKSSSCQTDASSATTIEYTGGEDTITITVPVGSYIHYLGITVKGDITGLAEMKKGEPYDYQFLKDESIYNGFSATAGNDKYIDKGNLKLNGNISYETGSNNHGLRINSETKISFKVPGDTDILYGGCRYNNSEATLTAEVDGNGIIESNTDIKGTQTEDKEYKLRYEGTGATITLTFPSNTYIHYLTIKPDPEKEQVPAEFGTKWDFLNDKELINEKGIEVNQGSKQTFHDLIIDATATGAKFNSVRLNNDGVSYSNWAQVNKDTIVSIPVKEGVSTISITTFSPNIPMTINKVAKNSDTINKVYGTVNLAEKSYVPVVMGGNDYFGIIEVTEETPQDINVKINNTSEQPTPEIGFIDTLTGEKYQAVTNDGSISLLKNHTYNIKSSDINFKATVGGERTITVDSQSEITIDVESQGNITVSGEITGAVTDASDITSIQFVSMEDPETKFDINAAGNGGNVTYTASVKPGDYNTVAVTKNGAATKNRVHVGDNNVENEEIFFVMPSVTTYMLSDDIKLGEGSKLKYSAGVDEHQGKAVLCKTNSTIIVPVTGKQTVTVAGWNSGTWDINGQNVVTVTQGDGSSESNPKTTSYTSDGEETSVTVNIKADNTYLKWIKVQNAVETKKDIKVPGDYPTITKAIEAIKAMDRTLDEDGRVTITLTEDIQEQVHVDVPYVSIVGDGDGHTISWYYGMRGAYYSVNSDGFYDDELFHDKYEKNIASSKFWGGVVIVDAPYFYAENVTFKNTYNYVIDDKEKADGAYICKIENNAVIYDPDELDNFGAEEENDRCYRRYGNASVDVTTYAAKERANALALSDKSDNAEFYKVTVLSSQDAIGYNSAHNKKAYFKECVLGGNVDYICGAGDMVFESCTLQILGYQESDKASYITAAQNTKYLFLNCTIKANTINQEYPATAYYGRPWKEGADVKFINTQTNGCVPDEGWHEMSGRQPSSANFGEYMNKKGDEEFLSQPEEGNKTNIPIDKIHMSDEDYNKLIASIDTAYLNGWTPKHYTPSIVDETGASSNEIGVVADNNKNLIVYATIAKGNIKGADNIGFLLSTKDNLITDTKEQYTDDNVYEKITYTEKGGSKQKEITEEGKYIFAYVIKDATKDNLGDAENLYVRTLQKTADDETVYGPAKTFALNTIITE